MALSDKDILITPNKGSSTDDPKIEFVGATSSSSSTITAKVYDLDGGTLSFEGTAGQLFSITNSLSSGSIFSVNDVSGIPSIDVNANGTILIAPFESTPLVGIGTSSPTVALDVVGNISNTGTLSIKTSGSSWTTTLTSSPNRFGTDVPGLDIVSTHPSLGTRGGIYVNGGAAGQIKIYGGIVDINWDGPNSQTPFIIRRNNATRLAVFDDVVTNGTLEIQGPGTSSAINFTNTTNSGLTINSNVIWNAGNDGSGSGLDADLLDGIQSSSFLRSDAADTASGVITFTARPIVNTGTTENGIRFRGATLDFVGRYGTYISLFNQLNTSREIRIPDSGDVTIGGNVVYTTGNDGAGSGLDADLLDGQQGSYYLDYNNFTNTPASSTPNNGTLTLNVSGTGLSGSASFTANQSTNSTFTVTSNATSANTASTIVARDGSGNFSAGTITATNFSGTLIKTAAAGGTADLIYGTMANNDFFRIRMSGASDAGEVEIATADNGNEPIYVRQYSGSFASLTRTLTLLNTSGNTIIPGTLTVSGASASVNGGTVWHSGNDGSGSGLDADLLDGYSASTTRNAANTIPVRDSNGYLQLGWINTTSGATTSTIDRIYASNDGYIRYVTPATLISQLGLWTSGNDGSGSGLDADLLDGENLVDNAATANTVAGRDASGDIYARLIRQTYPNQTQIGGGLVFRYNNSNDNYLRVCSDTSSIRGFLNVPTRTGGDASGTWGINITGSAGTLDGLDSTQFLRSDADDTTTGNLVISDKYLRVGRPVSDTATMVRTNTALEVSSLGVDQTASQTNVMRLLRDGTSGVVYAGAADFDLYRHTASGVAPNVGLELKLSTSDTSTYYSALKLQSNGVIQTGGNTIWHAGNDGAGSGLDADLLDGLQPSVSASNNTIVQRHSSGYIYANYFNTTPNDVTSGVTKVCVETGNDGFIRHGTAAAIRTFIGAGSGGGLDADLLDGQQGSYYLNYNNLSNKPTIPTNNNQLTNGAGYITSSGSITGSAGTLDGIDSSQFLRSDANDSASGVIDFLGGSSTTPAVRIKSGGTSWSEGLAIYPSSDNGFALAFYRTTASLTTNTNTWAIGNLGTNSTNNFGLLRNGLTGGSGIRADSIFDVTQSGTFRFGFTPTVGSNTIWHAGNDGAGSGLDADLLDGLSSGSFFRADASNGVDCRLTAGDGRGLRFWDSDSYKIWMSHSGNATWGGRLDSTSDYNMYFRMTGGTNRGFVFKNSTTNVFQIESTGQLRVASNNIYAGNANIVWHAGNDGAGSGLDADLLDGQQGSYYLNYNNLSNKPTIPTNNNQLTNGAGYITSSGSITGSAGTLDGIDSSQFLRSDADDTTSGQIIFTKANSTANGGGQIFLNGATGNRIDWTTTGVAAPSTTTRSVGTKLVLYPQVSASNVDYALGIDGGTLWYSVPTTSSTHRWYGGTTQMMRLTNSVLTVGGNTVWNAGNDGAGSGLDADLLDGISSASFLRGDVDDTFTRLSGTRVSCGFDSGNDNSVGCSNWFRSSGSTGWYNQTYAGGWYMSDTTWIRTYNNKSIYHNTGILRTDGTLQVGNAGATLNAPNGGTVTISGSTAWHAGNDGSGSGLDADTLDGVDSTQFLRSDANDTFSGTLTGSAMLQMTNTNAVGTNDAAIWCSGVSGAILLDSVGQKRISWNDGGGNFNIRTNAHFSSSADRYVTGGGGACDIEFTGDTANGAISFKVASTGTAGNAITWARDLVLNTTQFQIDGNNIWHAGNDGSGSGLDADLLDGLNAATTGANTIVRTDASGNIAASGNVTAYSSDRRLKENFNHIESPVEKVQKLNGYTFDWNEKSKELGFTPKHEKNDIGLIAQEVEDILPQAVAPAPFDTKSNGESKSGENYLTIQYERLVPLLVEAIKEQQNQINKLTQEIEHLKTK